MNALKRLDELLARGRQQHEQGHEAAEQRGHEEHVEHAAHDARAHREHGQHHDDHRRADQERRPVAAHVLAEVDQAGGVEHVAEREEGDRDAEVHREGRVEPQSEQLRPGEAPVGGEAQARMHDPAEVDVLAAGARHGRRQIAVGEGVGDGQHRAQGDHEQHVGLGHRPGHEQRDHAEDEAERVADRVEHEDVGAAELPHQARGAAQEQPAGRALRRWAGSRRGARLGCAHLIVLRELAQAEPCTPHQLAIARA